MALHQALASRFPLLDGIGSVEEAMADPDKDRRMREYLEPPLGPAPDVPTRDLDLDGPHGPVPVRVYGDPRDTDRPAFLWLHGGAFMMGDLDMPEADRTAREITARTGALVVSVDYRLAVGGVHHPVPLDDCVAAAQWLLGQGHARVVVGGASAGGNLATATALRLPGAFAGLVAVYPVLHDVLPEPTPEVAALLDEVPPALRFTPAGTAFVNANYLGGRPADGFAFPALADVSVLPPTLLVTAEYDDLRTTGEAFVTQLRDAGVAVRHVQADGLLHGFLNLSADLEPVDRILDLMATAVAVPRRTP